MQKQLPICKNNFPSAHTITHTISNSTKITKKQTLLLQFTGTPFIFEVNWLGFNGNFNTDIAPVFIFWLTSLMPQAAFTLHAVTLSTMRCHVSPQNAAWSKSQWDITHCACGQICIWHKKWLVITSLHKSTGTSSNRVTCCYRQPFSWIHSACISIHLRYTRQCTALHGTMLCLVLHSLYCVALHCTAVWTWLQIYLTCRERMPRKLSLLLFHYNLIITATCNLL